ncbi:hypothetical protein D3C85_1439790 [compost metagenome]
MKVGLVNIVALLSFVTFPNPTSEDVKVTTPVLPATLVTASVGVNNSCQDTNRVGSVPFKIKFLFKSVLIATSPVCAVNANIAV